MDHLAHFDHERIPERVVHAKGAGAFGTFEVTSPQMAGLCKAKMFSRVHFTKKIDIWNLIKISFYLFVGWDENSISCKVLNCGRGIWISRHCQV